MKYIKRIILLIAVVFATTLQAQTKTFNSQVRVKQVPLSSSLDSLVTINSDGLLTYLPKSELDNSNEFVTLNTDQNITSEKTWILQDNSAITIFNQGVDEGMRIDSQNSGNALELINKEGNALNIINVGSGDSFLLKNATQGSGRSIVIQSQIPNTLYEDRFIVDNLGNTTTQKLTIQDALEDNTANKIAVIDINDEVKYVDKDSFISKSGNAILDGDLTVDNIIGNGSQLTNVAKINQSNTFTEPQLIQKATATILTVKRLGVDINVCVRFQGAEEFEMFLGLGGDGEFKVGDSPDLAGEGNLIYHSGNSSPVKTINTSTLQTSATLNSAFPFADNPDGTIVVNKDTVQSFMYIRVNSTQWKAVSLGSTI